MKNEKGFSLVELLVVVIIIAIIAAIAIPNLLASRRAANEASAIQSLRTVHSAQATYQATTGQGITYANGSGLTGLVDAILAQDAPSKSGYTFSILRGADPFTTYCATATPQTGQGVRAFAVGIDGVIYANATPANISCSAGVVTPGSGGVQVQ